MRVIAIARLLAAIRLLPSLTRRPTWRLVERFRELREDAFVELVAKHYLIGYQQGLNDCNNRETQ